MGRIANGFRNIKQEIGIFRLIVFLVLMFTTNISMDTMDLKFWISDMIHGSHALEFRNSMSVSLFMGPILAVMSFYIAQTGIYLFIGRALEGKNTGLIRFLGYVIKGLQECANDPNFWSSSSSDSNYDNIEKLLKYRDNKMAFMSNREAAEYMKGTGHIDMMISRPDLKQSRKTLSYLNNKTAFMSNESALNFLKGK